MTDTTGLTTPDLQGARSLPGIRSRLLRPRARSSSPTSRHVAMPERHTAVEMIGIGGHLAMSPLPHHRAYGSVPRRFGQLSGHSLSR